MSSNSSSSSSSGAEPVQNDPATKLRELWARQNATGEKEYERCSTEDCSGAISMETVLTLEILKATLESRTETQKNVTGTMNLFSGILDRIDSSFAERTTPQMIAREQAEQLDDWDTQLTARSLLCTARDHALLEDFDRRKTRFDSESNLCSHLSANYQPGKFTGYDQFVPLSQVSWDESSTRWNYLKTKYGVSAPVEGTAAETTV